MKIKNHTLAQHEAAHAVIGMALGFRIKLVRVSADGGGLVDMHPDYLQRPDYRDSALAPFSLFLSAATNDFDDSGYLGPLPSVLPANGARAILDIALILAAGGAADGSDTPPPAIGSDLHQAHILAATYPEMAAPIASIIDWTPSCLAMFASEVEAVTLALMAPTDTAKASWLATEDIEQAVASFDADRWSTACQIVRSRLRREASVAESIRRAA